MIEQFTEILTFLLENQGIAAISLAIALAMYWVKKRLFQSVLTRQAEANRSGWSIPAQASTRRHETGIGTQAILVMRPPRRQLKVACWTGLFFGGGAAFLWFGVLPDPSEQTTKNWLSFAIMCSLSIMALFLFVDTFKRIHVSADDIVLRRFLRRPKRFAITDISSVEPAAKNPAIGVKLHFLDGRHIKILASYEGYAQVLSTIKHAHPDLQKFLMMGRLMDSANLRRKNQRKAS